ncbi:hypothetical protein [Azospirillum isscasi]|uniref:hypothetical protein n=1 Tax=Azospirillum isscasi TaxID=3053926 RepID=UPI0027D2D479|nr:hypothetical protein [Azospirillum isscasi]
MIVREVLDFADAKNEFAKTAPGSASARMLGCLDEESVNSWAEIAQCPAKYAYRCAPATFLHRPDGEGEGRDSRLGGGRPSISFGSNLKLPRKKE